MDFAVNESVSLSPQSRTVTFAAWTVDRALKTTASVRRATWANTAVNVRTSGFDIIRDTCLILTYDCRHIEFVTEITLALAYGLRDPLVQLYATVVVLYWRSIGINMNTNTHFKRYEDISVVKTQINEILFEFPVPSISS